MKNYYIFRHGDTFATKYSRGFYGTGIMRASILPEFTGSIVKLGQHLKKISTDFQVSSQLKRCKETAAIVTEQSGKQFVYDARLNEFFFETFGHFSKRVSSFLQDMEKSSHNSIVICTHGAVIAALVRFLQNETFGVRNLREFPSPGVLVTVENGIVRELNFNEK